MSRRLCFLGRYVVFVAHAKIGECRNNQLLEQSNDALCFSGCRWFLWLSLVAAFGPYSVLTIVVFLPFRSWCSLRWSFTTVGCRHRRTLTYIGTASSGWQTSWRSGPGGIPWRAAAVLW